MYFRDVSHIDIIRNIVQRFAIIRGEQHFSIGDENTLTPVRSRTALHFGIVLSGFQAIAIYVTAIYPVRHPNHIFLPINSKTWNLYLSWFRRPRQIAFPFQSLCIVNRYGDIITTSVFEFFNTAVNFSIVDIDITEVVGNFGILERLIVLHHQISLFVVFVQYFGVGNIVVIAIDSNSLTSGNRNHFFQPVFWTEMLCIYWHAYKKQCHCKK